MVARITRVAEVKSLAATEAARVAAVLGVDPNTVAILGWCYGQDNKHFGGSSFSPGQNVEYNSTTYGGWILVLNTREAPPCDLSGLEALPTLLRFWGAGKALTTLSRRLYLFTLQ